MLGTAAFVIALVGLGVACLSLGWQVATWVLSAGRVRVRLRHGVLSAGGAVLADVESSGARGDVDSMRRQGFMGPEVLAIRVANVGRAPVTVERYGAGVRGGGLEFTPIADVMGKPLPARLHPGEAETWMVDMNAVGALVYAGQVVSPGKRHVHMTVELATGRKRTTRHAIRV